MAFQVSPGVLVVEQDLTNVVPAVSTSIGGFVGDFQWGPVLEPTTVSSEVELINTFGKPTSPASSYDTSVDFFSAANFLSYSNALKIVRVVGTTSVNAVATGTAILIKNKTDWEANFSNGSAAVGEWAAKYPGTLGNSIKVSMVDSATGLFTAWAYKDLFDAAPGTSDYVANLGGSADELHIVVVDAGGAISGTPGTVLETFAHVSKAGDAKNSDGSSNYYKDVITGSKYIWWMDHTTTVAVTGAAWGSLASATAYKLLTAEVTITLAGGIDTKSTNTQTGWDQFANAETIDVNLLFLGGAGLTDGAYVIQNIAETRKDCMVFVSPLLASVYNNSGSEATAVIADRTTLGVNSSYGVMDSGWKYQYDKYNDVYRWIPLNADIAGLCAYTDNIADPWFSPAGLNRGQIKNVVKLAYSPDKADRDTLYKSGVNPVIVQPGQGTFLYGDKTLLSKPSAFDRINVRRLFIILEKAIAIAGQYQLFEINDAFTRAQFRNLVEPFLRDVQGRRGIYAFKVVCDETNNTSEVIDSNEFVASIFIQPARSINFITLNFIATRTGVSFSEVAGS